MGGRATGPTSPCPHHGAAKLTPGGLGPPPPPAPSHTPALPQEVDHSLVCLPRIYLDLQDVLLRALVDPDTVLIDGLSEKLQDAATGRIASDSFRKMFMPMPGVHFSQSGEFVLVQFRPVPVKMLITGDVDWAFPWPAGMAVDCGDLPSVAELNLKGGRLTAHLVVLPTEERCVRSRVARAPPPPCILHSTACS